MYPTESLLRNQPEHAIGKPWRDRLANWSIYAAAAGAALAAASSAEAGIIYVNPTTKPDAKVPGTAPYAGVSLVPFTIDGLPVSVFVDAARFAPFEDAVLVEASAGPIKFANITSSSAKKFALGDPITGANGVNQSHAHFRESTSHGAILGKFGLNQTGFIGFQLPASKGGGSGWLRAEVIDRDSNGHLDEVKVIDWAYNDAGGTILAGQTTSTPEPRTSALALLGVGAAGILAWRKRRAEIATPCG